MYFLLFLTLTFGPAQLVINTQQSHTKVENDAPRTHLELPVVSNPNTEAFLLGDSSLCISLYFWLSYKTDFYKT